MTQERENELPHLAGIATAELALALNCSIEQPAISFFEEASCAQTPVLVAALAFDSVPRAISVAEVDALRDKIEGARRREKRCSMRLFAEREPATGGARNTFQR